MRENYKGQRFLHFLIMTHIIPCNTKKKKNVKLIGCHEVIAVHFGTYNPSIGHMHKQGKKCAAQTTNRERSGSVVECLTRDRGTAGSSLIGATALCP